MRPLDLPTKPRARSRRGSAVRTPLLPLADAAFDPANARECPQDGIDLVRLEFASVAQQNQLRGGRSATADGIGKRQERVSRSGAPLRWLEDARIDGLTFLGRTHRQ